MTDLSIIIVNYKSSHLLLNCLRTVYRETKDLSFEVIVVDNQSGDESEELIKSAYPQVSWLQMRYNAGFARANNEGIRQSKAPAVLLLNPDTLMESNAIGNSYKKLMQSDYVAAGIQLLNPDRSPQISGNYAMRGGLNYLLPLPYIGNFIKWMGEVFKVKKPNVPDSNDVVEVDWINGAFLMVKKDAIAKAGLLDEDFFLYAEEAEWCSRLKKHGKLCIFGSEKVIHLQGETVNATLQSQGKGYYNLYDRKGLQIMVSNFLRIRKEFGIGWFLFDLAIYFFTGLLFPPALLIHKIVKGNSTFYKWRQVKGFILNLFRLLKFLPRIISNQPYFYKVI